MTALVVTLAIPALATLMAADEILRIVRKRRSRA